MIDALIDSMTNRSKTASGTDVSASIPEFVPPFWLRNGHLQTIGTLWPRRFPRLPESESRLLPIDEDTRLRLECNWQPDRRDHPTLVLVHGLEGSSDSQYMIGVADKGWGAGFNSVRVNIRNCGDTEHLTPHLYNAGLSGDLSAVINALIAEDQLTEIHLAGYSMGGNTLLKLAGEWGADTPPQVVSLSAVSPSIDLALCANALNRPSNRFYERRFVRGLRRRMRRKRERFPGIYDTNGLDQVQSVREFDDKFTAPLSGYGNAENYYYKASALRVIDRIALPTLILAAQDDPFIPVESFSDPALTGNPNITVATPAHGGHSGFIQRRRDGEDSFWAENRVIDFALRHSRLIDR